MKPVFKKIFSLALVCSSAFVVADDCNTCTTEKQQCPSTKATNCFVVRSTSRNNALKNAGLDPRHQHLFVEGNHHNTFNATVEYAQSFSNEDIGRYLWGPAALECDKGVQVRVRGSQGTDADGTNKANGTSDLVAENFFLPKDFNSTLTFKPDIKQTSVHLHFYMGPDKWTNGMYLRVYAPITHARWDLDFNEAVAEEGNKTGFAAGEIAGDIVGRDKLFENFSAYARGNQITIADDIKVQPLNFAQFSCGKKTDTKLADLRAEIGWNFAQSDDYHVGLYFEGAAPTGSKCSPCHLFAPVIGNGKFWELGGGMTVEYVLWRNADEDRRLDIFLEANATHLFQHTETRTFDLKNKQLSRYMLAEKMQAPDDTLFIAGAGILKPNAQFAKEYAPVANFSTQNVDVRVRVQGEALAKLVYSCPNFSFELGYNFWGKSCEIVSISENCPTRPLFSNNTWALRGDAQVFGFRGDNNAPVALGATRNAANIFSLSGGGAENKILEENKPANNEIDNGTQAYTDTANLDSNTTSFNDVQTSNPAVFITLDDLNIEGTGTRGLSHKVFTHFNYTWNNQPDLRPYVGIGASAEFGQTEGGDCCDERLPNDSPTNTCGQCVDFALSQWSVWVKGGLSFN